MDVGTLTEPCQCMVSGWPATSKQPVPAMAAGPHPKWAVARGAGVELGHVAATSERCGRAGQCSGEGAGRGWAGRREGIFVGVGGCG